MSSSDSTIRTTAKPIPSTNGGFANYPNNLSMTPGGTLYATTPGGTKIAYDRNTMLLIGKNSPMSRTPPSGMAFIPGVTLVAGGDVKLGPQQKQPPSIQPQPVKHLHHNGKNHHEDGTKEEMFQMDD